MLPHIMPQRAAVVLNLLGCSQRTRVKRGALTSSWLLANTSDRSTSVEPTCTLQTSFDEQLLMQCTLK
jgi:hypothetical protein